MKIYKIFIFGMLPLAAGGAPSALPTSQHVRSGTAFFIAPSGLALTSAHVVVGCRRITIWSGNTPPRTANVLKINLRRDIALLGFTGRAPGFFRLAEDAANTLNVSITTLGYGLLRHDPRRAVQVTGRIIDQTEIFHGFSALVVDAVLDRGHSGSPLMNEEGAVVGLVTGRFTDTPAIAVAVAARDLRRFLGWRLPATVPPRTANFVGLEGATALVQCSPRAPRAERVNDNETAGLPD